MTISTRDINQLKEKVDSESFVKKVYHNMFLLLLLSFLLNIILGTVAIVYAKKKPSVYAIDNNRFPAPLQSVNEDISKLVGQKQFIYSFLTQLFNWNEKTYKYQMQIASYLWSESARTEYFKALSKIDFGDNQITSSITITPFDDSVIKPYKDGYVAIVQGIKTRITGIRKRDYAYQFTIAFHPCKLSEFNIWGLEVFEYKEDPVSEIYSNENQSE